MCPVRPASGLGLMISKGGILSMKIGSHFHSPVGNTIRLVIRMLFSFDAILPSG